MYKALRAIQLKHGPDVVYEILAEILNNFARTRKHPTERKTGK